jgi:cobalt/nickel transport system ATP-binding protein
LDEPDRIIRLEKIRFAYTPSNPVFSDLEFSFTKKERAGLVGPNGSGKTTLVHLIMGLLRPDAGRVEIFGREREREADFFEVRARIGFLFQDPDDQLFCPTVAEDVAFGPLNLGKPKEEVRAVVKETLQRLGLAGFEDRVTYKLSGGEKRLVSLATILAMKPDMLLLDEPVAGLDEETTDRLAGLLLASGLPYLVISHDREFLHRTTEGLYQMDSGRVSRLS